VQGCLITTLDKWKTRCLGERDTDRRMEIANRMSRRKTSRLCKGVVCGSRIDESCSEPGAEDSITVRPSIESYLL
jgi:hypothetical protein